MSRRADPSLSRTAARRRAVLTVGIACALAVAPARAASPVNPRLADAPLAIERDAPRAPPRLLAEKTDLVDVEAPAPAPLQDAPAVPARISSERELVRVAVGLGPSAPGSRAEKQIVDALMRAAQASRDPQTELRRLRAGAGEPRRICRERRDDLIIMVDYIAERGDPVLVPHDCTLDRALGIRGVDAAAHDDLVSALWAEHHALLRQGVEARRAGLAINPKVRTGLIAGGAILVVGAAVGLILASTLRSETVVITVEP